MHILWHETFLYPSFELVFSLSLSPIQREEATLTLLVKKYVKAPATAKVGQ